MLRPRASDMTGLAVPGSLAARSADRGRHAQKPAAMMRTTMTRATGHARLRLAWRFGAGGGAFATACSCQQRCGRRGGRAEATGSCPARRRGFPTIAARTAGRRRGTPPGCRQTPRWRGTAPASPDAPARCRGGRHIQRIELPNGPRTDAASACAEPAGRSGRSCHHGASRPERSRRTAFKGSRRKKISRASQWTSHSGGCAGASGAGPICIGGIGFGRSGEWGAHSGRTLRQD